jgi:FixJ family two-component response regulator
MAPLIAVVDDDVSVRKSLDRLIRSVRLDVKVFASAEEFLNCAPPIEPDCLILDVNLPGMSGIELHRHLLARKYNLPIISLQHMVLTNVQGWKQPRIGLLRT